MPTIEFARAIRTSIGSRLRDMYSELVQERLPPKIADLLSRLDRNRKGG